MWLIPLAKNFHKASKKIITYKFLFKYFLLYNCIKFTEWMGGCNGSQLVVSAGLQERNLQTKNKLQWKTKI